jgi:hypothetical protein
MRMRAFFLFLLLCGIAGAANGQMSRFMNGPRKGSMRAGLQAGAIGLGCDYTRVSSNYLYLPYADLELAYFFGAWPAITTFVSTGKMAARDLDVEVASTFVMAGLGGEFRYPVARGAFAPFLTLRLGALYYAPGETRTETSIDGASGVTLFYGGGIGFEYIYRRTIGVRTELVTALTLTDKLDNRVSGPNNDGFTRFSIGVNYYFTLGRGRR